MQRFFYELPIIKDPKAKKIATLVLMNEFDYIIREAGAIFDFYGMNREKPVIDEILYNSDYALIHFLGVIESWWKTQKGSSRFRYNLTSFQWC